MNTSGKPIVHLSGMAGEFYNFVGDLEDAINSELEFPVVDFNSIMICGMGGSAICGDIIRDCIIDDVSKPITVQRFPELPRWVDKKTYMIITSYSGNTLETLSMYHYANEIGCPIIIMTAGGKLEELGKQNGNPVVKLKPGYQPRSALGMSLGQMANIIGHLCGTDFKSEIKSLIPSLYKLRDELNLEDNVAWKIAKDINGRIPIIYATSGIYASAIRWKSQINENSKMIAFAGSVPEFNHNEISGWSEGELRDKCVPLFLYECDVTGNFNDMALKSIQAMRDYGQDVRVVNISGKTSLERTINAVIIGDYVSLYLAYIMGVDPMDITAIVEFKTRLNKISLGHN